MANRAGVLSTSASGVGYARRPHKLDQSYLQEVAAKTRAALSAISPDLGLLHESDSDRINSSIVVSSSPAIFWLLVHFGARSI